jgi:hypothetical protein
MEAGRERSWPVAAEARAGQADAAPLSALAAADGRAAASAGAVWVSRAAARMATTCALRAQIVWYGVEPEAVDLS